MEIRRLLAFEKTMYLGIKYTSNPWSFTLCYLLMLLMDLNAVFPFSFSHCQYLSFISSVSHNYTPPNIITIVRRHLNFKWDFNFSIGLVSLNKYVDAT